MLKSTIFVSTSVFFLSLAPLIAQDYSQGTGQDGCYFGQCPQAEPPLVDEVPDVMAEVPDWDSNPQISPQAYPVDRCWVDGAEIFTFSNSQIYNFNLPNSFVGSVRFPSPEWQCALDLMPVNGVGYCVLNQANGLVFRGGPPSSGGVQAGYCARCNAVGC